MNTKFDPRTEEGYRNIVEMLADIRGKAKSGLWQLYSEMFGVNVEDTLDFLYKQATEIYNQSKTKVDEVVNDVKTKISDRVNDHVDDLVDEYIDTVLVPQADGNVSRKSLNNAHDALANFAKWVISK